MKIKSIKPNDDGMAEYTAQSLWSNIEGFAAYSFNKSHSYEYSLISWITMWLKVYYPAEFYAGALSVVENEDKQASLIADAQSKGFKVLPPCLMASTDRIEIRGEWELLAPFQAVKGISSGAASALMQLRTHYGTFTFVDADKVIKRRKQPDGKFAMVEEIVPGHIKELTAEAQQAVLGRSKVNSAAVERLEKVGALFKLKGGLPPMHPDRLRDRLEYLPGYTIEKVKATRGLAAEHLAKIKIAQLVEEVRGCTGCDMQGKPHPVPRMGDAPKFMVVTDTPNFKEEREGKLLAGDSADVIKACLKDVGLKAGDGYYTTLVKSAKPREQKALTNAQINACKGYLAQEIDILKPPVIIAMGSNSIRYFAPDMKGNAAELAGKAIYRADLDATIIFGLNPGMLFHDPSKINLVQAVFNTLSETLS
jgi:uracil-DNA glycosylase family 4